MVITDMSFDYFGFHALQCKRIDCFNGIVRAEPLGDRINFGFGSQSATFPSFKPSLAPVRLPACLPLLANAFALIDCAIRWRHIAACAGIEPAPLSVVGIAPGTLAISPSACGRVVGPT